MRRVVRSAGLALLTVAAVTAWATPVDECFKAAEIDDLRDVKRMVGGHAVDAKALDARGDTLLIVAIRNDANRVIDFLIGEKTTDLDATNVSGETAMMIAAYRKRKDVVEKLIARGAEVNRRGWTALHYAASVDAGDIVGVLLDNAAYIDAESPNKTTPLMMAARGGFDPLCRLLVEAGADPSPRNERDLTAADFARKAGEGALAAWLDSQSTAWRAKYAPGPAKDSPLRP